MDKKKSITAHMIVKNEDQWVWYAIQSVINYVDKFIIYDTGSTDQTVDIIKTIKSKKIVFEEKGPVNAHQMVHLRNEQIKRTETAWFLLVDGDEAWPKTSIETLVKLLPTLSAKVIGVVVKARLPVGDLFHYQDESAGRYQLLGKRGHYNIRAYRKLPDYLWQGEYPLEAYCDRQRRAINTQDEKLTILPNEEYWHLRHLPRSTVVSRPVKLEIGKKEGINLPEVFYKTRPLTIPPPWVALSTLEKLAAYLATPLRKLKRFFKRFTLFSPTHFNNIYH